MFHGLTGFSVSCASFCRFTRRIKVALTDYKVAIRQDSNKFANYDCVLVPVSDSNFTCGFDVDSSAFKLTFLVVFPDFLWRIHASDFERMKRLLAKAEVFAHCLVHAWLKRTDLVFDLFHWGQ